MPAFDRLSSVPVPVNEPVRSYEPASADRAALIARGFAEMTRFGLAMGAKRETLAGLSGLGDLVMLSWLAEGCRRSGRPFAVYRSRNRDLMDLFGLESVTEPGGVRLDEAYRRELADRCQRPRLDYIREFLNLAEEPVQPAARIDAVDREWAASRVRELGGRLDIDSRPQHGTRIEVLVGRNESAR